jgi:hypothetical protein
MPSGPGRGVAWHAGAEASPGGERASKRAFSCKIHTVYVYVMYLTGKRSWKVDKLRTMSGLPIPCSTPCYRSPQQASEGTSDQSAFPQQLGVRIEPPRLPADPEQPSRDAPEGRCRPDPEPECEQLAPTMGAMPVVTQAHPAISCTVW